MMRRLPWSKLPHGIFVDEAAAELGLAASFLRIFLLRHCALTEEGRTVGGVPADGAVGWLVTESGRPYTTRMLARMTPLADEGQVEVALGELERVGVVVRADDGAIGYAGWRWTQESPVTTRTRRHRARKAADAGDVPVVVPETFPERTEEKRGEEKRSDKKKTSGARVAPEQAPLLAVQVASYAEDVVELWHELRVELGLADEGDRPRLTPQRRQVIERVPVEEWRVVLRRMAAKIRQDAERQRRPARETSSAVYFTLDHLARPKNRQLYLDAPTLDRPSTFRRLPPVEGINLDEAEGLIRR